MGERAGLRWPEHRFQLIDVSKSGVKPSLPPIRFENDRHTVVDAVHVGTSVESTLRSVSQLIRWLDMSPPDSWLGRIGR